MHHYEILMQKNHPVIIYKNWYVLANKQYLFFFSRNTLRSYTPDASVVQSIPVGEIHSSISVSVLDEIFPVDTVAVASLDAVADVCLYVATVASASSSKSAAPMPDNWICCIQMT